MDATNYAGEAVLDSEGQEYVVTAHDLDSGELELVRYTLEEVDDEWHELKAERITRTLDELDDEGWSFGGGLDGMDEENESFTAAMERDTSAFLTDSDGE